jgi:flagellar hook capping protein FlgD/thermolysin metallopeptidase-like protein
MSSRRIGWIIAALLIVAASPAYSITRPAPASDGSVSLPGPGAVHFTNTPAQEALEASPAWQAFRGRYGDWNAVWNEATASPHRTFGPPIALAGFADQAASVDRAVRAFIHANADIFGPAPDLELVTAERAGIVWYVRYRQTVAGVPVLFSDWEFRVGANGNLFAFGADAERPAPGTLTRPGLVGAVAREAAKQGLAFNPGTDRVEGGSELALLPYPTEDGTELRLVYEVDVRTANPRGNWLTYVDAATGDVLLRANRVRYDISGTVTALVHPLIPTESLVQVPLPHLNVTVGPNTVPTDAAGAYSAPGPNPATVTAALAGLYCAVNRQDGGLNASFSTSAPNPSVVDIAWGLSVASDDAERDGYYHVNQAHDYVKSLEPGFTGLDYAMPCAVNIADVCNAFWDGNGVNFFAAGGGCANTATVADVVFHEYGHGINDFVYMAHGAGGGMFNGALHEGMADVNAAFMRDNPLIGVGFSGIGTFLRNCDNTLRWPNDASGDPHATGEIISGAFWDLRQAVGLPIAEHLAQFAKHGIPDDANDGVAMFEFFTETLIADDDDANLSNGTPHANEIVASFSAHGIGTNFALHITHTALADRPAGGDIPITAQMTYTGPIGALDAASPAIHYALNNGGYSTAPMTATGNPNEFAGIINVPGGCVLRYYLTVGDTYAQTASLPASAPEKPFTVLVGPASSVVFYDMETTASWSGTAVGDNAATGRWIRVDPVGTNVGGVPVQPEDDHTPNPAVFCWVTGQGVVGGAAGAADVDGGHTTLTSPAFNAVAGGIVHPIVEYYRWYSNNAGSTPGTDFWVVDISNDGGLNWTHVENTNVTDNTWRRVAFRIEDYVTPTSNMRMRFIASDEGDGSLVEAAVDDWRLWGFPGALLGVGDGVPGPGALALSAPVPNPSAGRTRFGFTLPEAGGAAVRVYDIEGRLVRTLWQGALGAGAHSLEWDGRDQAGHSISSGAYFVRLEQGGREAVRAVVRVH